MIGTTSSLGASFRRFAIGMLMVPAAANANLIPSTPQKVTIQKEMVIVQPFVCSWDDKVFRPKCPRQAQLRGRIGDALTPEDYPASALREKQGGVTYFHIDPDSASGRTRKCTITESSGSAVLDEAACRLLTRRLRFVKDQADAETAGLDGRVIWVPDWRRNVSR